LIFSHFLLYNLLLICVATFAVLNDAISDLSDPEIDDRNIKLALEAMNVELKNNSERLSVQGGTPVLYGSNIHLLHIESGLILSVNPNELAECQNHCMRAQFKESRFCDEYSSFIFQPRYSSFLNGDVVKFSDV
jgi:hypothetical protein